MNEEILEITKKFHDTYEKLANEYTYETREDTKVFDINSNNGKLMYATVNEIVNPILKENQELNKQVEDISEELELVRCDLHNRTSERDSYESELNECLSQQKEFIKYLENEIYSIEPKGTGINYNCEYDSEEDYINAMKEQSKLNTLKEILSKYKEIIGDDK